MLTSDKVAGVVFGTAIGDALGYPVEFANVTPKNPVVTKDSLPNLYSDDTQMMRATFEGLWRARTWSDLDHAAEEVAAAYVAWSKSPENNRAPGRACMLGCRNLDKGIDWRKAGKPNGGGCGTAMRSMAYGVWHWNDAAKAELWAAQHALMTHRSPMAQASAAAVAAGIVSAIEGDQPFIIAREMIRAANRYDVVTAEMLCSASHNDAWTADEVLNQWRGWAGHEAVAASLWCFLSHPDDYRAAVLTAVNSPGDSDSLGAITGALVGARLGVQKIPVEWRRKVEKAEELRVLSDRIFEVMP